MPAKKTAKSATKNEANAAVKDLKAKKDAKGGLAVKGPGGGAPIVRPFDGAS